MEGKTVIKFIYRPEKKIIIAIPEKLAVAKLAQCVREGMKEDNLSLEDLLADLREGKHEYIKEPSHKDNRF